MQAAGLVKREACPNDRRGQNCVMTDAGWNALVSAAPAHVSSVREHLVDVLSDDEFTALGEACAKVAARLDELDS